MEEVPRLPNSAVAVSEPNEEIMRFREKERKVSTICNLNNIKTRKDDNRFYIRVDKKPYSSTSYEGLIEKLYNAYFGVFNSTVAEYFEIWMNFRTSYAVPNNLIASKTPTENRFVWNRWYRDYPIAQIRLSALTQDDCERHFVQIINEGKMSKSKFNNIKSVLNMLLEHARTVDRIVDTNVSKNSSSKNFTFYRATDETSPLTEKIRSDIIHIMWGSTNIYAWAIIFSLYLPIRIGELKALKWEDVVDGENPHIIIRRFVDDHNNIIEGTKAHRGYGQRKVPLTDDARRVLDNVKKINPEGQYIFFQDNDTRPLSTVTYNRWLKGISEDLGFTYRSSHQMRFSVASILYKGGMPLPTLQMILGHTTLSMTLHYLRNVITDDETLKIATSALDFPDMADWE